MTLPKLSKTQQELLGLINAGWTVQYAPSFAQTAAYYFRRAPNGGMLFNCTAAAKSLLAKGVVERYDNNKPRFGSFKLRITADNLEAVEALLKGAKP